MSEQNIRVYRAWDINTRLFHWINVLCVIVLSILGLIMLNKGALGISGTEASIGLKTLHVTVGYVFATNLVIRIIWGFIGPPLSSFKSLLPGKNFRQEVADFKASVKAGKPQTFIGHNPLARVFLLLVFVLLSVIMVTGMVRAGTDIYYPPFGEFMAEYVAAEGVDGDTIMPYDETGTDPTKLDKLKAFKGPFGTVHIYGAYLLWLMIVVHLFNVIRADARGHGTLISAMFSGKKHLPREPEDL
ncbi:MAG: cytochrome b/b6 domain-containing protein [Lysobacterales bacterium]|jgi:cytochrome b